MPKAVEVEIDDSFEILNNIKEEWLKKRNITGIMIMVIKNDGIGNVYLLNNGFLRREDVKGEDVEKDSKGTRSNKK